MTVEQLLRALRPRVAFDERALSAGQHRAAENVHRCDA